MMKPITPTPDAARARFAPPATRLAVPDEDYGILYPRWAFLGLIFFVLSALIAMVVPQVIDAGPTCQIGTFCLLDRFSATEQAAMLVGVYLLFWGVTFLLARKPLALQVANPIGGPSGIVQRFLWLLSHFERASALILLVTGLIAIVFVFAILQRHATPFTFAASVASCIVAVLIVRWWVALDGKPIKTLNGGVVAAVKETLPEQMPADETGASDVLSADGEAGNTSDPNSQPAPLIFFNERGEYPEEGTYQP